MTVGDGHEVEALADVRSTDARRAQIRRPDGVTRSFQVSRNKVEPPEAIRARNLLSKDDCRAALADEPEPLGPEVAVVGFSLAAPRRRERLTGAASGPNRPIVWPAGGPEGVGPDADAGEEVGLDMLLNVSGLKLANAARVDIARRHVAAGN